MFIWDDGREQAQAMMQIRLPDFCEQGTESVTESAAHGRCPAARS